jgi:hypothetical protein
MAAWAKTGVAAVADSNTAAAAVFNDFIIFLLIDLRQIALQPRAHDVRNWGRTVEAGRSLWDDPSSRTDDVNVSREDCWPIKFAVTLCARIACIHPAKYCFSGIAHLAAYLKQQQQILEISMTRVRTITALSVVALAGLAWSNAEAVAGPIVPPGHYCMEEAGEEVTDCSFTSHAQCQQSASGLAAECYGPAIDYDRGRSRRHRHG